MVENQTFMPKDQLLHPPCETTDIYLEINNLIFVRSLMVRSHEMFIMISIL